MLAVELVRRGAARHRDRVAVQVGGEAMTYAEVIDQAERITRSLLGLGLAPGTPIALLLDNGRYSMPVDFALLLGGFVRVPLNSRLAAAEHAQMVSQVGCPVLLYESPHAARVKEVAELAPGFCAIPIDDGDGPQEPLARLAARQPSGDPRVPREVEDALLAHPSVLEAAVVAAPDEKWVEAVTAFVVLSPGAGPDEPALRDHVRGRLAGYKVPKRVHIVEQIPKSAVGKVLRRALRDPLWAGAGQRREERL